LILGQTSKPVNSDALRLVELAEQHAEGAAKTAKWVMKKGSKWVKMKTTDDHLDKDGAWRADVNSVTSIYSKKGQYIQVTVTDSSPSGDVMDISTYYFWPSKKVAMVEFRTMRIDYGGQIFKRWFDRNGKQVLKEEQALDGNGEESKDFDVVARAKENKLGGRPYPATYSALPFAKLAPL